ncbi:ferredoxin [Jatrophihabitans cynanchi]|jgi:ferredoxin|uniref:Ferredoxin n=1 Tax=Jatrophihabitans cynanchi TaxID=2944128 RepID=A0ABY7K7A2_9ACTN|nr:ferredoxin [Jatrophihabitans sp. SB3-54]WAX59001.1 ferredoxin [Jatrophihabitans sp. SB3-54]
MRIKLDEDLCMGYANCVVQAPDLFDIDEETDKAVVLVTAPSSEQLPAAKAAVQACPAMALRLEY